MKSASAQAASRLAAKARRDGSAPSQSPSLETAGQALSTAARSLASASGPGSQATTSRPRARQRAAQPAPITPVPTTATLRLGAHLLRAALVSAMFRSLVSAARTLARGRPKD